MTDIDSALQILSRNNYKLTKQRKELLKYLYQFQSEYINVSQVDEFMHQLYPKMSHNTIYRNIRDFDRLGIVEMQTRQGVLQVKYQCDLDRKSTRLNSSHVSISYAVFCLKKKKANKATTRGPD